MRRGVSRFRAKWFGKCGRTFADDETVWHARRGGRVVVGETGLAPSSHWPAGFREAPIIVDVYEPWHPAVDDYVRVRLSGQCRWDRGDHNVSHQLLGHDRVLDGKLGTVVEVNQDNWYEGHDYFVELYDCPCDLPKEPGQKCLEWLAAAELELVTP